MNSPVTMAPTEALAPTIEGADGTWETVIGIEVHAQILSQAKLFSGAAAAFGTPPNSSVSLVDAAMPGMLPVLNRFCVEQAVRSGLGLGCQINLRSVFDRKNYFYPDLPQGYQISQYSDPIATGGQVAVDLEDGDRRTVGIVRLHIEQDAGKSIHDQDPDVTLVDLNRTGVALMEVVTEPDLRSPAEAGLFLRKLRSIFRCLRTCDGNMQEGSLRADVNVSIRRPGAELGTRCEIKNLNSVRFLQQAIRSEAERQIELVESGGMVEQETRLFDTDTGQTRTMRSKEDAQDYRYFPDPDLPPLVLDESWVEEIRASLPELPDARRDRLIAECGLPPASAASIVEDVDIADYFEAVAEGRDPKMVANWLLNELLAFLNRDNVPITESPVSATALGSLLDMVAGGKVSGRSAKDVLALAWEEGGDPVAIVREQGLEQVTDAGEIEALVARIVADNPVEAERALNKPSLAGWFVGQVMRETRGRADPAQVNRLVREKLGIR